MQIRRLTTADYDEIVNLWSIANLPYKPKGRDSREAIAAEMKLNPDFFLGAFEGERLVVVVVVSCDSRKAGSTDWSFIPIAGEAESQYA